MIMITVRIVSCEPSCAAKWHSSPGPRPSEMPAERTTMGGRVASVYVKRSRMRKLRIRAR